MRTTITLDDDLLEKAMNFSGITGKSELVAHALNELIRREVTERFLALEGTMPEMQHANRGVRYDREPLPTPMLNDSND